MGWGGVGFGGGGEFVYLTLFDIQTSQWHSIPLPYLQDFFRIIYLDSTIVRSFHANVNGDEKAAVPGWEGNRRVVAFRSPVNAPAVLKSLIGAEFIDVQDTQTFQANENGTFRVESRPIPQIPGASNFTSTAVLLICNEPGQSQTSCTIHGTVSCSASGPWGLINTVETFMAREAHNVLKRFLDYCRSQIVSLSSNGTLPSLLAAAPPSPLASRIPSLEGEPAEAPYEEGLFYDAEEVELASEKASGIIGPLDHIFDQVSDNAAQEISWERIEGHLKVLRQNGEETNLLLSSIDSKLTVLLSTQEHSKARRWFPSYLALGVALTSTLTIGTIFWMRSHSRGISRQ